MGNLGFFSLNIWWKLVGKGSFVVGGTCVCVVGFEVDSMEAAASN